jgi:uncharacterized protein YjbI with pentapeptide repeats
MHWRMMTDPAFADHLPLLRRQATRGPHRELGWASRNGDKVASAPFQRRQACRKVPAMTRSRHLKTLGLACLLGVIGGTALADCSDFAAPGVNWRRCVQDGQDLRGLDLSGATLDDASFKRTDLSGALLAGADARRAKFVSATMHDVVLDQARLIRADLTTADLTGASLRGADLTSARLFRANLSKADLSGARLANADLLRAVLAGATWIDGKTVCAENSIGQCNPSRAAPALSETEPSG